MPIYAIRFTQSYREIEMTYINYDELIMDVSQESIFDLDKDDWRYNAVFMIHRPSDYPYIHGYFEAAEYLADNFLEMTQDLVIYPTMFLYRHCIELILKNILYLQEKNLDLTREKPLNEHRLPNIWSEVRSRLQKMESLEDMHLNWVEKCINELDSIDSGSFTFRYPVTNKNTPTIQKHTHINILQVQRIMRALVNYLEIISEGISMEVEFRAEMRAEHEYGMGLEHDEY